MNRRLQSVLAIGTGSLIALAIVFSSGPAGAQSYGPHFELTGFGGYYIASDLYTVNGYGASVGLDNSFEWGGRAGLYPKPYGGIEFAYTRAGSDVTIKNSAVGYNPGPLGKLDYNSYDINFVGRQHNVMNNKVTGFGTIGFGWTHVSPKPANPNTTNYGANTLFGWNFGLGADVALSTPVALRFEGRWRLTNTDISTGNYVYCDYYGYCYSYSSNTYSSGDLTAGITYRFGQK